MKKSLLIGSGILVTAAFVSVYLFGLHHGRNSEGLSITKEAIAAQTKGADIAIHECFITPEDLIRKQKWTPGAALNVGTQVHTSPAQFGKVMSEIKPRMAVGYHFINDFDTQPNVEAQVRTTYDGPLAQATDYMVFNVTKENIKVRMAVIDEDIWPQPAGGKKLPPDASKRIGFSEFITSGRVPYKDVVDKIYSDINKKYGTNIPTPK